MNPLTAFLLTVVVFEFLSLQTCINSWAESLGTPSHLRPWGPGVEAGGGGAGYWHVDHLYSEPVCQALHRACLLQSSWGLEGGSGEVGRGGQFSCSPSSLRGSPICPVPPHNTLVKSKWSCVSVRLKKNTRGRSGGSAWPAWLLHE